MRCAAVYILHCTATATRARILYLYCAAAAARCCRVRALFGARCVAFVRIHLHYARAPRNRRPAQIGRRAAGCRNLNARARATQWPSYSSVFVQYSNTRNLRRVVASLSSSFRTRCVALRFNCIRRAAPPPLQPQLHPHLHRKHCSQAISRSRRPLHCTRAHFTSNTSEPVYA